MSSDCSYCNTCFCLFYLSGRNPKAQISNLPRECIRNFFPKRKCFVFDRPINDKELLANIEKVAEYQLDPKFQEQTKNFCSYILTQARAKTLRERITITGKRESQFHILWGLIIVEYIIGCVVQDLFLILHRIMGPQIFILHEYTCIFILLLDVYKFLSKITTIDSKIYNIHTYKKCSANNESLTGVKTEYLISFIEVIYNE